MEDNKYCEYCGKVKQAIGNQRKNGKDFKDNINNSNDWKTRKYCRKCYKESRSFLHISAETDKELTEAYEQFKLRLERIKNKHIQDRKPLDLDLFEIGDTIQFKRNKKHKDFQTGVIVKINWKSIKIKTEKDEVNISLNLIKNNHRLY